jgi:hypothetical protein
MKADNIFVFNINPERVEQVVENVIHQQTKRENITKEI